MLVFAWIAFSLPYPWPEYAGDSLLPRLQIVLDNTLALAPSGSASTSKDQILKTNSETMRVLTEFLEIADDAAMEGRTCALYHDGIVEAAGTLRRISNRLSSIATARVFTQMPQLDPVTEFARERVFSAIRGHLMSEASVPGVRIADRFRSGLPSPWAPEPTCFITIYRRRSCTRGWLIF
jgi:hypothetical protein